MRQGLPVVIRHLRVKSLLFILRFTNMFHTWLTFINDGQSHNVRLFVKFITLTVDTTSFCSFVIPLSDKVYDLS